MRFNFKSRINCLFSNRFYARRIGNFSEIKNPTQIENNGRKWQTIVCSNGVIACWHPNKGFPYEHSRPVDLASINEEKKQFLSRVNNLEPYKRGPYGYRDDKQSYEEKGPDDRTLREIFYTNMQEWRPRTREERLYKSSLAHPVEQKNVKMNTLEDSSSRKITSK